MVNMKRKGFTLIELLAVLVVLAILALISIPIVIRIINHSREESYKRSIANYGKIFEKTIAMDSMEIENASNDYKLLISYINDVEKNYVGNRIQCEFYDNSNTNSDYSTLINGKLILRGCRVAKTIGDENDDVYRYENGKVEKEKAYKVYAKGQDITLKGEKYWVLSDSPKYQDYVVALKDTPLSIEDINTYGVGYINKYTRDFKNTVHNLNGYGRVAFYSSERCGYINDLVVEDGCTNDYASSDIKHIIDSWAATFNNNELKTVDRYNARLINISELEGLGYVKSGTYYPYNSNVPTHWICDYKYPYWTMSAFDDPSYSDSVLVWIVSSNNCNVRYGSPYGQGSIRPVINVKKSAVE